MDEVNRAVRDDLHGLLVALVKAALVDDAVQALPWRREAQIRHGALVGHAAGSRPNLDAIWSHAVREAEADEAVRRLETASPILPVQCPLSLGDLTAPTLDIEDAAERIRVSAATG